MLKNKQKEKTKKNTKELRAAKKVKKLVHPVAKRHIFGFGSKSGGKGRPTSDSRRGGEENLDEYTRSRQQQAQQQQQQARQRVRERTDDSESEYSEDARAAARRQFEQRKQQDRHRQQQQSEDSDDPRRHQQQRQREPLPPQDDKETEYSTSDPEYSEASDEPRTRHIDDLSDVPPLPTLPARITQDLALPIGLTPQVLDALGSVTNIPEYDDSPRSDFVYNQQHGAHPASVFFLHPNPYLTEQYYYPALNDNKLHPRYSYNDRRQGLLEHIRGPHYTPQLGQTHALLQGKIELFRPIRFDDKLQYVIQAPEPSFVERRIKKRDQLRFDDRGNIVEIPFTPGEKYNQYFISPEHVQIQTDKGDLCVDYQLQHLFYDNSNNIIVTHREQTDRQILELEYDAYLEHKATQLNKEIGDSRVRYNVEKTYLKSSPIDRHNDKEYQHFLEFRKIKHLQQELKQIGGLRPKKQIYWDYVHNNVRITKADIHKYIRYTSNNNKMLYSDHYARFHGFRGTLCPTELLATLALDRVSEFAATLCPPEPKIFTDVKYEAQLVQMEHLKQDLLEKKQDDFSEYYRDKIRRRRAKQGARYEEMRIDLEVKLEKIRAGHEERKKDGKALGIFGKLRTTRNVNNYQEKLKELPLPEDIDVSDSEADTEFDQWESLADVQLNQDEINHIKSRVQAPPWHSVFQHPRRFLFRNLCPVEFPPQRALTGNEDPIKILEMAEKDYVELNFYARVLEDKFDFYNYEAILQRASNEFIAEVQKAKEGLIREQDLDLTKMVAFEDVCRDRPLEIEVWFELPNYKVPEEYMEKIRKKEPDPRMRPSTGTKCFYGIVTFDSPFEYNYMDLDENQMKKLFAFRQGITLRL